MGKIVSGENHLPFSSRYGKMEKMLQMTGGLQSAGVAGQEDREKRDKIVLDARINL